MSSLTDEIKRKVRIEELLGIGPGVGRYTRIQCPMPAHDDKDPSCSVNHKANRFRCFACDEKGSVIDLVMKRDGRTLQEAIKELAERANIPFDKQKLVEAEEEWTREKAIRRAIRYAADYYHRKIYDSPGAISYLAQRFVSLDIVEKMKIGIADGSLWTHLQTATLDKLSLLDFANAGLIKNSDKDEGVYRDFFKNRITFPLSAHGDILNISGRAYPDAKPKYLHLPGRDMNHFYNEDAIEEAVKDREASHTLWLFEGHMDTLSGIKAGLPAVGVVGTGGMTCPEKLDSVENLYICGDRDDAGQKAIQDWVKKIQKHFVTVKIKLVELPDGIKDFNEWYKKNDGHIAEKLRELQAGAKDPIAFKISKLHMAFEVDTIWPLIRHKSETERSLYFHKIKERLSGTTVKGLAADFKKWEKDEQEKPTPKIKKFAGVADIEVKDNPPANQWIDVTTGQRHFAVRMAVQWECEGEIHPSVDDVVVRLRDRDGGKYEADVLQAASFTDFKPCSYDSHLITGRMDKATFTKLVNGEADEHTGKLLRDLEKFFATYIWHPDPSTHLLLALWTMGTYVSRMFGAFPRLVLNGPKKTGKSTILTALQAVCFNGQSSALISRSSLFRTIDAAMPTILWDETEDLGHKTPENADVLKILNIGYKNDGSMVSLTQLDKAGGKGEQQRFSIYAPIVIASITEADAVFRTRAIPIRMNYFPQRPNLPKIDQEKAKFKKEALALRNRLYCWFASRVPRLLKIYESYDPPAEFQDRDREMWLPLLSIAELADEESNTAMTPESVVAPMLLMGVRIIQEQKIEDKEDNLDFHINRVIHELLANRGAELQLPGDEALGPIRTDKEYAEWFSSIRIQKLVCERLLDEAIIEEKNGKRSLSYLHPRRIIAALKNYGVITDLKADKKPIRNPMNHNRTEQCIRIRLERLETALKHHQDKE